MNKYLLYIKKLIVLLFSFSFTIFLNVTTHASTDYTNFYIDQVNGSDNNNGLSPSSAWKSLSKVNSSQYKFNAGDSVLFHTDQTWEGQLELNNLNGEEGNPIIISSYGEGNKPHLAGKGEKDWTVKLQNCHYTTFTGFEITNKGETPDGWRYAIEIRANNTGEVFGTIVSHNEIHDVNGEQDKSLQQGGAILIKNTGTIRSRLVGTIIEYNHIHDVVRNGIYGNYNFGLDNPFRNKDIRIRKNLIERIPGDAIVAFGLENAIVEYNICRDFTPLLDSPNNAAAGIWAFNSINTIIQHNEVSGHQAKHDGQGYDADFNCENTIIQYNYSFNNVGGFALICSDGSKSTSFNRNPILRYNLSIGDGFRTDGEKYANKAPSIHIAGNVESAKIYNNTIYATLKPESVVKEFVKSNSWFGYADGTEFKNNTFYGVEAMAFELTNSTNNTFDNNAFYGGSNVTEDLNAFYGVRPENDYNALLIEPATIEGTTINNNGGFDFFGNPVTTDQIGAFVASNNTLSIIQPLVASDLVLFSNQGMSNAIISISNLIDEVHINQEMSLISGNNSIDVAPLIPGVYWLDIQNEGVSTRLKFIKIEANETPSELTYFFDPLDNLDLTEAHSNAVIYKDGAVNFNGDEGRLSRISADSSGVILYHLPGKIETFEVEYWSWKWEGTGLARVFGSNDGSNFEEIILEDTPKTEIGDRYYTMLSPNEILIDKQYQYLKIELSGNEETWKDQIGSVKVFYIENEEENNNVEGISLNVISSDLLVGETQQLQAEVFPSNANEKGVVWSSSNNSIVSVDNNGLITAISGGETTVSATSIDGNYTASATVLSISSGVLSKPSNIIISTTTTTATITWDEAENATWYTIGYRLPPFSWVTVDSITNQEVNEYTLEDLNPNSVYSFRIRSYNASHSKSWYSTTFTTDVISQLRTNEKENLPNNTPIIAYPNPVKDILHLKGSIDTGNISIVDLYGKIRKQLSFTKEINVSDLPAGIYFIKIDNKNPIRVIKQ